MFAPSFPYYRSTRKVWHMVHPLNLARSICNTGVVNCVEAAEELPEDAYYCSTCERRERFAGRLNAAVGQ